MKDGFVVSTFSLVTMDSTVLVHKGAWYVDGFGCGPPWLMSYFLASLASLLYFLLITFELL